MSVDEKNIRSDAPGVYVFCFATCRTLSPISAGMDDGYPIFLSRHRDVAAVCCLVSLNDFCGPGSDARMNDLSWIGPLALRHEKVVEQVMQGSPVFPVRFGTLFSTLERLDEFVTVRHDRIWSFLDRVSEKEEWSVKGFADRGRLKEERTSEAFAKGSEGLASLSPGARYFQEKRIRSLIDGEVKEQIRTVVEKTGDCLIRSALDYRERRLLPGEDAGRSMVANWAFLIPFGSTLSFRGRIREVAGEYESKGIQFTLSGPWPPYSFCPALGEPEVRDQRSEIRDQRSEIREPEIRGQRSENQRSEVGDQRTRDQRSEIRGQSLEP